ncbi:MAG: hypothetical protein J6M93_01080 [Succinivibrio sp.]|nr:hypothetical protein [Succinivibrio sp.]
MLSYAVLLLNNSESSEETSVQTAPPVQETEKSTVPEETVKKEEQKDPAQLRSQALNELSESVRYFESCGVLSRGYEGCSFSFSEEITSRYEVNEDAVDDGFIISLRLKNTEDDLHCSLIVYSSSGDHIARSADGNRNDGCFPENFMNKGAVTELYHATDHIEGNPAPSGAIAENERHTAQTAKPQDSLSGL